MNKFEKNYPVGGAFKSLNDSRDYQLDKLVAKSVRLPSKYTVSVPAIIADQKEVGSCVACSLAQIKHCQEYIENSNNNMFSAGFIYANRNEDDYQGSGMFPRDAIKHLCEDGTCYEQYFPGYDKYEYPEIKNMLDDKSYIRLLAKPFKTASYYRLNTLEDIKTALYTTGCYVEICYDVYKCLYYPDKNGMIKYHPFFKGKNYGGHSMVVCAYDDDKKALGIINSWSEDFGVGIKDVAKGGCIWIPYNYPFSEAWAIIDAKTESELLGEV